MNNTKMNTIVKITDENYFDYPALSASGINNFYEHPAIFWASSPFNPAYEPKEKTDPMIFGSLLHAMLLEGQEKVDKMFVVNDENRNSNKFKEFAATITSQQIIKTPTLDKAKEIIKVLHTDAAARQLLATCRYEEPFTWEKNGMRFKMKIDAFKTQGHLIVDYKSTEDTTEEELNKTITNRGYHRQAALYMEGYEIHHGIRPRGFVCLFQNKKFPEIIVPVNISHEHIELGEFENDAAIRDIQRRLDHKLWKTTSGIVESKPADWYKAKGINLEDDWNNLMMKYETMMKKVGLHVGS